MNILKLLTPKRIVGNVGEDAAGRFLKRSGCKILKRNYVANGREIDIIADDGKHILFVEVKTRTEGKSSLMEPRPASSVNSDKRRGIISAAKVYFSTLSQNRRMRFDVIEVYLGTDGRISRIEHLTDAFRGDTGNTR